MLRMALFVLFLLLAAPAVIGVVDAWVWFMASRQLSPIEWDGTRVMMAVVGALLAVPSVLVATVMEP